MSVSGGFRSFTGDAPSPPLDWLFGQPQSTPTTESFLSEQPSSLFVSSPALGHSVQQGHATHPFLQQQQEAHLFTLLQQMHQQRQQQQMSVPSWQQTQLLSPPLPPPQQNPSWQQTQPLSLSQQTNNSRSLSPSSALSDSSPARSSDPERQSISPFSVHTISSSDSSSLSPPPSNPLPPPHQNTTSVRKTKQQQQQQPQQQQAKSSAPSSDPQQKIRSRNKDKSKRGLTKCACVPCRKIKAACDATRPCARCVRVGKAELCINHVPLPRGGYRVPKAKRSDQDAPQESPLVTHPIHPIHHTLSHPSTSQPLFEATGLLLDLVPPKQQQPSAQANAATATSTTTTLAAAPEEPTEDWSACLPAPTSTPISELMWLEDEALFSTLDQFDKEAQNPSRKNQQLLVSMAWVLCDVICFSGCFQEPSAASESDLVSSVLSRPPPRRSSGSSTSSTSSAVVPSSPRKPSPSFHTSASSMGFDSSHPFFPLFRSLASPDNVKRERLWSLLNAWKHASEIQQTLQLMARAAPDDTVRELYEAELVKSSFLPFGVVVCPLNHYFAPGLPPVTNQKLNAMLGYSKEDVQVVCSSCPFYRMSERHSLSDIKRLAYQAIRHGRTSFTLPMTFVHKNKQPLRVVVSLKIKYHNYLPMLCVCYVQLADATATGQVVEITQL